jgi:hypothetical protein
VISRLATLVVAVLMPLVGGEANRPQPMSAPPLDTILRPDLSRPPNAVEGGLAALPSQPHVTLGLRRVPIAGGIGAPRFTSLGTLRASSRAELDFSVDALASAVLRTRTARLGQPASARFLPPPARDLATLAEGEDGRFVTEYADLGLSVRSRMELGGDWTRFQPCDLRFGAGCNPSLVPQLSPDVQFGVVVNGSILDRVRVDVDFDQAREFDAANRINFFYEGGEDDVLRRLEVGDVTFNLPRSRFLTEGIPAGNFGFQAEGQVGAVEFQTVWAQQRGDLNTRVFQLTGLGDQRGFVQQDTVVLDDADYVRGQFFFLFAPTLLDRYPHVDALALDPSSASISVTPGDQPIQLYRFEDDPVFRQQVEGFIQADAVADGPNGQIRESGWFRYLQEGTDYYVHPSGLWIALRQPLSREEMLAVTYITAAGDTIGDYNPEAAYNRGERPELKLLKASGANHQPGRATWDLEMHQIYRVSGSADVEPGSVDLSISLGELSAGRTFKRRPAGEDITFLRLFGLDEEAPTDRIDPSFLFTAEEDSFQDQPPVQGTFIVFPTLRPFAEPPPLVSLGLDEVSSARILGDDANERIYEEEDPFERDNSGRFRLSVAYRLESEGVISSFSLGAFGIRDESERIYLGDRLLVRGADYDIDYDVGQVQLLEPEMLFASSPDASVRATWEQRSLFQVTPTQVFGFRTHADLGDNGGIDLLGLYQTERSVINRPVLGTEPRAAVLGGLSGRYGAPIAWMDRVLERIPGLNFAGNSSFSVEGEVAVSIPNPNTQGSTFIDDFDGAAELRVSLLARDWQLAGAPAFRDGAERVLPPTMDVASSSSLVWQDRWIIQSPSGDSVGVREGLFPRADIDNQIRVTGSETREPALLMTLGRSQSGNGPGWRSAMTPLSTHGLDLTRTEFLEFYVAGSDGVTLVLDLGTVSEDAFFVDASGNTSGLRGDGRAWGLGILDQEADPRLGELWNDARDAEGVWSERCRSEPGRIYPAGDERAACSAGNGRPDSEDLDSDGNLDVLERHLRYVVELDGSSPFLERNRNETGTEFQLYRIPIRGPAGAEVGGSINDADLRAVRHLRVTASGAEGAVQLARMRLVGSRWIKRASDGVLAGIVGDTLTGVGSLEVSSVSRLTVGDDYVPPPTVLEQLADPTQALAGQGVEFNEKALGVEYKDVPHGARAEVYFRFPQRPRDFLQYREARLWVVARSGDFGPTRPNRFFFKVGSDPENFYLYRTPLSPPSGVGLTPVDWLPEVVVDFDEWVDLRRRAEELLSLAPPGPGDPPVEVWSADSAYAVVLADRGRAPNLAAVRELSLGVWNETGMPGSGEIWINDLRLASAVQDAGLATSFNAEFDGAGVVTTRVTLTDRGAFFRQLKDRATYQDDRTLNVTSGLAVDRWLPSAWGLDVPVTFQYAEARQDPVLLANSDVRADRIANLRATRASQNRVALLLRRRSRSADPVVGFLVDGLDVRASYGRAQGSTITSTSDSRTVDAGAGWFREPESIDVGIVPGFARGFVRSVLPGFLEDKVANARLRLTPERVSLGGTYFQQDARIFRYERIVVSDDDSLAIATLAPREFVRFVADVRFRPLEPLTADVALLSVRDLLPGERTSTDAEVQRLVAAERARALGLDLGWETNRTLRTALAFRPSIASWLRTDLDWGTAYQSDRNTNFVQRVVSGADTSAVLTRSAGAQRDWGATLGVSPTALTNAWLGAPFEDEDPDLRQLRALMGALRPVTVVYRDGISSRFDRDPVDPRYDYQLGWADMDAFRFVDADTAATLTDRASWRVGSGLSLPGGAGLQVGYLRTDATTLDARSDRRTQLRTWPDVQATLPTLRPPAFTGIRTVNLTTGLVRARRLVEFGGRALQERFDEDTQVPLDVSIQWLRSLSTAYRGAVRHGKGSDPTGSTERELGSHRISVTTQLLPAGALARRLERPVRMSLVGALRRERNCRSTAKEAECVPFLDQVTRTASMALNTSVGGFEFGVQLSYDDRKSFVGQRTGSTQFQLGLFGQLEFGAALLPTLGR